MSDCTTCPNVVGDSYERDCAFPDCVGGWEKAYIEAADEITRLRAASEDFAKMVLGDETYNNSPCQAHPFELVFQEIERLRAEADRLSRALAEAAKYGFVQGYNAGHDDTVEGWYGDPTDKAADWYVDAEADGSIKEAIDAAMLRNTE